MQTVERIGNLRPTQFRDRFIGLATLRRRLMLRWRIVEGEKCAEAARKVFPDFVVTTSPGGAKAVAHADWTSLKQRNEVLVWGDADRGWKRVCRASRVDAASSRRIPIFASSTAMALASRTPDGGTREPPLGWDVAEALEEGWTVDALRVAVEQNAKPWTPPASRTEWSDDFEMTAKWVG